MQTHERHPPGVEDDANINGSSVAAEMHDTEKISFCYLFDLLKKYIYVFDKDIKLTSLNHCKYYSMLIASFLYYANCTDSCSNGHRQWFFWSLKRLDRQDPDSVRLSHYTVEARQRAIGFIYETFLMTICCLCLILKLNRIYRRY